MERSNMAEMLIQDINRLIELIGVSDADDSYGPPGVVIGYLLANKELLEWCLHLVYERMTEEQRLALVEQHKELEPVAAGDFKGTAEGALREAELYWGSFNQKPDRDSLNMLRRGLAFAKYAPAGSFGPPFDRAAGPLMHPVSDYIPQKGS